MKCRFLVLAAAIHVPLSTSQDMPAMPPARVEVAVAEMREMSPTVEVPGNVVSLNDSRIAAEVEGVLVWTAEVGDAVERGDELARVDPRLMEIAVRRARANVGRLDADLSFRQRQLERTENLALQDNAAATLLDEARAQRDQAVHQLADARAQLEQAEDDLARATIRAAFAGHVTERLASVGEYIDVGEDVLRLVDTHRLEIALPAPISLARFVRPGQPLAVRNGKLNRQYPVRTVVPVGDAISRMVEIRLSAPESDWLVGTPVQVSLPGAEPRRAVAVPRDALVERAGQALIYKVNGDGTAEQIVADIESTVGLWVAVRNDIVEGDRVIIRGAERLMDGQAVEVIQQGGA
ncbi:MAG: efflux RND transporter periplasmic adaptor subunit [Pseudomonadota bacterium]